ncbi:sulfite exporter TauE/SafE family protein [Planctomycetota bacterium]|nr:sulfite exporter TauE/SafE family protein [Planctomycetota bacterium]
MPDWSIYLILPIVGFAAGFINTIAGGGSFLTLPVLIYLCNLPPQIANATNRFSVVFYTTTSTTVYHAHGYGNIELTKRLMLPSILGALSGSYSAVIFPSRAFTFIFGIAMIGMALLLLLKPKMLLEARHKTQLKPWMEIILFFFIGFYGGFLQAGVGLLLLIGLAMTHGQSLLHSNGVKVALALGYAIVSVAIFAYHDQIIYMQGFLLAIGAMAGALIGAKTAIKKGTKFIYYIVVAVAVITGSNMIYRSFSEMI